MSRSTEWMPALSKVKSQSYVWCIENFRDKKFTQTQKKVNGVVLYSSEFQMSLNSGVKGDNPTDLRLSLTRHFLANESEQITHLPSPWLRLSLAISKYIYIKETLSVSLILGACARLGYLGGAKNVRAC